MKTDPLKESPISIHAAGVGLVTEQMVQVRAAELAVINGRSARDVSKSDWEQAQRELTGRPELDPAEVALEALPESERWEPVPSSSGHIVPVSAVDEDDEEGRSLGERLVEKGVQEAEHDQMLESARESQESDRLD